MSFSQNVLLRGLLRSMNCNIGVLLIALTFGAVYHFKSNKNYPPPNLAEVLLMSNKDLSCSLKMTESTFFFQFLGHQGKACDPVVHSTRWPNFPQKLGVLF